MRLNLWVILSVLFYVAENCYFGWNRYSSGMAESVCDFIVRWLLFVGIFFSAKDMVKKWIVAEVKAQKEGEV